METDRNSICCNISDCECDAENVAAACADSECKKELGLKRHMMSPTQLYDPSMSTFKITKNLVPHSLFCSQDSLAILRRCGLITTLTWSGLAREMAVRTIEAVAGDSAACGFAT